MLDKSEKCGIIYLVPCAGIAHPVERHLAKVEVASSSLVARSIKNLCQTTEVFCILKENGYLKDLLQIQR